MLYFQIQGEHLYACLAETWYQFQRLFNLAINSLFLPFLLPQCRCKQQFLWWLRSILGCKGFAPWSCLPCPTILLGSQSLPKSVKELLLAPASILAVIRGGEKSDCILVPPVAKSKNNMHWDLQLFPILRSFVILWSQNSPSIKSAWI